MHDYTRDHLGYRDIDMSTEKTGFAEFDATFDFLTGDMDWEEYGGSWYRKVDHRFHVVKIFDWREAVGEDEASEIDGTHHIELVEVDTNDEDRIKPALECCGYYADEDGNIVCDSGDMLAELKDEDTWRLIVCEAMVSYGSFANIHDYSGSDLDKMFATMLAESNQMVDNPGAYERRMNRPVNAIGSTAREMQRGDINSALLRGLASGDERAELMVRMGTLTRE